MPLTFPDSPSNGDTTTLNGVSYTYDSAKTVWVSTTGPITTVAVSDNAPATPTDGDMWFNSSDLKLYIRYNDGVTSQWIIAAPAGPAGADSTVAGPAGGDGRAGVYADMASLIAKTGMVAGDTALVTALNKVFMYTGSAWFLIATMTNDSPTAITGVDAAYNLATDGTATIITAVSTDPEGFALTWSYAVTSGSLGSTATVSQADNVFTVTPSTTEADAGSFSITFSVTDGATGAVSAVSAFTLSFSVQNSRYTALLVKATNTGSNQTFDDASTSNHTITVAGDTTTSTFSPYRAGGYSFKGDGTGDYLQMPHSTDTDLAGDFTIECWVYLNSIKSNNGLVAKWATMNYGYVLYASTSGVEFNSANSGSNGIWTDFAIGSPLTLHQWHHLVVSRTGSTISTYLNGTRTNTSTDSNNCSASTPLIIGSYGHSYNYEANSLDGYLSNVRIVNGTGLYTGTTYTVPTAPLTPITNTKFLLGDLPYFKDQSTSNHAITVNGNVSLEPKSVFDNAAYSEAAHGESAYFDGTGDSLSIPHHADFDFSGDYVIEFWFNLIDTGGSQLLFDKTSGSSDTFQIYTLSGNQIADMITDSSGNTIENHANTGPVVVGTGWHHFSLVRDNSAGTYVTYLDGVVHNTTSSASNNTSTADITIGCMPTGAAPSKGYISDFKFLTAIPSDRNAAFTLPTSPSTPDSNTKFLLNPETSISDLSQSSAITCFGDAATSTTQVKFAGTKSIYLDGTGDYIQINNIEDSWISGYTGDFTIEFWWYPTNVSVYQAVLTAAAAFQLYTNNSTLNLALSSTNSYSPFWHPQSMHTMVNNTWQHLAIVRNGNVYTVYVDGVSKATTTSNDLIGTGTNAVQLGIYTGNSSPSQGYFQDFRITKGLARYTADFTPPTAELEG